MTIYSKFNNIDDEIRNEKVRKINKIIINKIESRNYEKNAYNISINQSREMNVVRSWNDTRFKEIYENNINILCLNLKFKSSNKDIDYMSLDNYFKHNHNIDDSELIELLRTTNTDYSKTPLPILSQPSLISDEIIRKINSHNERNGTEYGFHISDIFALEEKPKKKKGDCKYLPKFQLEKNEDGRELLINILKMIEDSDDTNNNNTIMKIAQNIQHKYNSRKSKIEHPLLILIFLPMGQSINILQRTLMRFIEDNKLFDKYHYCASCSNYKSDEDGDKKFLNYVDNEMKNTHIKKKRGCFLFLGDQGRIGITYPDCDITISLDNGQEISKQKQTNYRALTEADGKTVGINFDMNIQRVYSYISYVIREYKKNNNDNRSYKEILQYLYEIELFIFNPDELGFGNSKELVIEYFSKYEEKLKSEISSEAVLENIMCNDDLGEFITQLCLKNGTIINPKLKGVKPDCPEGGKKKTKVDSITDDDDNGVIDPDKVTDTDSSVDDPFFNINKTKRLYQFMTSLICLLLRKDKINPNNKHKSNSELLDIIKTKKEKDILLKKINDNFKISENYLNKIINKYIEEMTSESNEYILDEIFEIYARSSPEELRKVIEKHFIPSDEQRKKNAEIPTPVELVDDMLNKIPDEYFTSENKTLEPCCGKGNFVLAIFERYFEGLSHIENEIERCKVIIEKCIYFCDLDEMNVYITKELLICHTISKINKNYWYDWDKVLEIINFKYNTYVGNTLELNIKDEWGIDISELAVIGNPPYTTTQEINSRNSTPLYNKFVEYFIDSKILLYVIPSRWFITGKGLETFRKKIQVRKDIISIDHVNDSKTWFGPIVDIKGGCCILYRNKNYNGLCKFNGKLYDLNSSKIIINPIYLSIIDIVKKYESIDKLFIGRGGIETNDKNLNENKLNDNYIKCYVSTKQSKNRILYIEKTLEEEEMYWKVISPTAVNGAYSGFDKDKLFILNDKQIHTGSYVSFKVQNNIEAKSLLSYLKTNFVNKLLSIRKISQTISKDTIKYIPIVPLNREWTDLDIYKYFKFTNEEIKLIERTV